MLPIAVVRENARGETRSHALLSKSVSIDEDAYVVTAIVADIYSMGYKRIILKSDQENAMKAVRTQVKRKWDGDVVPRFSPKGKSAANGVVEKAVQEVEGQVRTMILALESRIGCKLELDHPVMYWLVEYASELINRIKVQDHDYKTSYHRTYGKPDYQALAEFGEAVHYQPLGETANDDRDEV